MHIRGFAMTDGVSFTAGKHRVTGRILPDGSWEIKEGGGWRRRFSLRQILGFTGLLGLEGIALLYPRISNIWLMSGFLAAILLILRLKPSQRRFHGAEHMAVNIWEGREPSVLHPGCGSNLVLLLLPGLVFDFLPFSFAATMFAETAYLASVFFLIWPGLQKGLKRGRALSVFWWGISRKWQRWFVDRPKEEELLLACKVMEELIGGIGPKKDRI